MKYSIQEIAKIIRATHRTLNDGVIERLLIDSRMLSFPETTLFFALKTRTNDGHRYLFELYRLGVRSFVVNHEPAEARMMPDANFLVVTDVLAAMQSLAAYHRKRFQIPVIGITGSNGKTIVKELLYQLLHADFNIVRSPRSYNSQIGAPLSVWQMDERHTLGIFEAGISQPDEMEKLQRIILPTIGIITNIGEAHQENFASATQKCLEKLSLFTDSDVVIYNADDDFIASSLDKAYLSHKAVGWSRRDSEAPLYIKSIQKKESTTELRCEMLDREHVYEIPFTDDASIEDVIHCIALMLYLKPTSLENKQIFSELEPVAMRLEVKEGINGCQLINDTYNSDINSLDIALDFQLSRRAGKPLKTTIVISDILQSGMLPKTLYRKVAELLRRKHVERIIGIGRDLKEYAAAFEIPEKEFYLTTDEFIHSPSIRSFDHELVLLKGSRVFHFERITELLEKRFTKLFLRSTSTPWCITSTISVPDSGEKPKWFAWSKPLAMVPEHTKWRALCKSTGAITWP